MGGESAFDKPLNSPNDINENYRFVELENYTCSAASPPASWKEKNRTFFFFFFQTFRLFQLQIADNNKKVLKGREKKW